MTEQESVMTRLDYDFHGRRLKMADSPYRPAYHFCPPGGWLNDPNGTVFWRGQFHMFYQFCPDLYESGKWGMEWGHAVSDDLLHWRDLPIALSPEPGTCDAKGCWSGTSWVEDDRVIAHYHAHRGGNCFAVSSDELLLNWEKQPGAPAIPWDPEKTYDPCIWKDGDTYFSISGRITGARHGHGGDQEFGGRDRAFLYKSRDLVQWDYAGIFYEGGEFTEPGEDCACPDFFPIGGRHMLLFLSHNRGAQYYLGSYVDGRFHPDTHGRMNFTCPTLDRLGFSGDLAAPILWKGTGDRRVMIAWVAEGQKTETLKRRGWAGIMSLPRDLKLLADGTLGIAPIPELSSLRRDPRSFNNLRLAQGAPVSLEGVQGDSLEIAAEFDYSPSARVGIAVRRSPGGEEETLVIVDPAAGSILLNPAKSSLDPEMIARDAQMAPLRLAPGEPIRLRIFVDRCVVEVFANDRQCLTKRIFPSRSDSLFVRLFSEYGEAVARTVDVWRMEDVWAK